MRIDFRRIQTVVDSGADCSVMKYELFHQLPSHVIVAESDPLPQSCVAANGTPLETVCQAVVEIEVGGYKSAHRFQVVKNLRKQLILGSDYLEENGGNLDFTKRQLTLRGKYYVPLYKKRNTHTDIL